MRKKRQRQTHGWTETNGHRDRQTDRLKGKETETQTEATRRIKWDRKEDEKQ